MDDIAIIFEPIVDFIVYFMSIPLTFAGIEFTTGSVIVCVGVAGIIGMFIRG